MKKFVLTIAALLIAMNTIIGQNWDRFFSTTKGDSFTYTVYDQDGDVEAKYVCKNKEVEGADLSDASVLYEYQFWNGDGEPLFDKDNGMMDMKITLNSEGTTSYMDDMSKSMAIQDIITMGDISTLPSDIKVGAVIPDSKINVKVKNVGATFSIEDRKVLAKESVTTPAGTFECYKMDEMQYNKVLLSTKTYHITTWYAKNIGCVKQMVYDKKGRLVRSFELTALVQ